MFKAYRESYTGRTVTPMTHRMFGIFKVGFGPSDVFTGTDIRDHMTTDPEHYEHRSPETVRRMREPE